MVTNKLLTVDELAARLGIARRTVYRWIDQGMPYTKVGPANKKRFDIEAVEKWCYKEHGKQQSPGK